MATVVMAHGFGGARSMETTEGVADATVVYDYAVRHHWVSRDRAGGALGWPAERVERALDELRRVALLAPVPERTGRWRAVPPTVAAARSTAALEATIDRYGEQVGHIRTLISGFAPVYDAACRERDRAVAFQALDGPEEIDAELVAAASRCTTEVRVAQPGGVRSADLLQRSWPYTEDMLKRGVRLRAIHQHPARFSQPVRTFVEQVAGYGGEVRTLDEFFADMVVFDREVAFLPTGTQRRQAVAVYQPAVVEFLIGVFDRAWAGAKPFRSTTSERDRDIVMSDVRRKILRLLVDGATDEMIASRVGLSVRTCRAHVAKVAERLGARSRCQLGFLVARSGLVDEVD